jgi:glycine cleavage system H lipoate-binding protein
MRFATSHAWIRPEAEGWCTWRQPFAARGLGEPVFLDLPEVGKRLDRGEVGR